MQGRTFRRVLLEFPVALRSWPRYYLCKLGLADIQDGGAAGDRSMVSGFNTEIEIEGTVFHIQTEAWKERGIETSVYVKGAVVHSLKTPHSDLSGAQDDTDQQFMHQIETQHRQVIAQIRAGEIRPPALPTGNV